MANTYTQKQLEDFTKKAIVVTPTGLYKLSSLAKKEKEGGYCVEFTSIGNDRKENGVIKKIMVRLSYPYFMDFVFGIFGIFSKVNYIDSYIPLYDTEKKNPFNLEVWTLNEHISEVDYFKEFFINYAKYSQNLYNEMTGKKERFNLEFMLLNQK